MAARSRAAYQLPLGYPSRRSQRGMQRESLADFYVSGCQKREPTDPNYVGQYKFLLRGQSVSGRHL